MKEFVVTGQCVPGKHYMADTGEKIDQILELVEAGHYFCINRARRRWGGSSMGGRKFLT